MRSRSISRRATLASAASSEKGDPHERQGRKRQQSRIEPPQYAARRHDARRRIGAGHGRERAKGRRASAAGGARRQTAEHSRHHGRRCRLVQYRRLSPGHHVRQDAEPRQARRRRHALHRLLRRSELHRRPRQLHHRANSAAHRPHHGRPGRRRRRHAGPVGDDGADPQVDGLRHRPVRQEPSRRLEQISADAARLRRILRLPLPPRRDVRSVLVRLSAGLDRQIRPAQPGAFLRDRCRRSDGDAALGQGRQAAHRRRRPAQAVQGHDRGSPDVAEGPRRQIRHGDLRRSSGRADQGLHGSRQAGQQAVLHLAQHHAHARLHLSVSRSTRRR